MTHYPSPGSTPNISTIPQAWLDKLATVQLPNVSVATATGDVPTYPNNENDGDSNICSFTTQCVEPEDLFSPPGEKIWAVSIACPAVLHPKDVLDALYSFPSTMDPQTSVLVFTTFWLRTTYLPKRLIS